MPAPPLLGRFLCVLCSPSSSGRCMCRCRCWLEVVTRRDSVNSQLLCRVTAPHPGPAPPPLPSDPGLATARIRMLRVSHCIPPCSHQRRRPSNHWRVPLYLCPQSVLFPFLLCFSVDISNQSTVLYIHFLPYIITEEALSLVDKLFGQIFYFNCHCLIAIH